MDKQTVKLLLESYRPQDAHDTIFAEALREVARDPELAAWFAESQRFDEVMTSKLHDFPVPASVKTQVLLGMHTAGRAGDPSPARWWAIPLAIAAGILVLGSIAWHFMVPARRLPAYATQAINFTGEMPALQFVCFNAADVAGWVNNQPGAQQAGVTLPRPPESANMVMIGSSIVEWNGRPVVMIALQNGRQMAMLYIVSGDAAAQLREGTSETYERDGWVVRATRNNGQLRLITTKGKPQDLNFPVPF